jgi:ABC-type transport system substrate-binding protein
VRRHAAALALALAAFAGAALAAGPKVLRVPFLIAETHFDPATVSDLYSNNVMEEIFEAPLTYDFLARPAKLKPQTLVAMPEISPDARVYTLRVKPGILFADDPAFGGQPRELVAADYAYTIKRLIDPANRSPNLWLVEGRIAGVEEAVARAKAAGKFDYDAPLKGLEVVDRYTLRITLDKPDYNFLYILAMCNLGAQAREVVERYGADIGAHPVGTGPFRLAEWKRSAKIVLERNPRFREIVYSAEPAEDDLPGKAIAARMAGKRLPLLDRVEISIIEESQPRWLAFLNGELDWVNMPYEFLNMAIPGGKPAPWLAARNVNYLPSVETVVVYLYFNMKDPTVGGYTPEKVALRRAISLAYDVDTDTGLIRNGTAIAAQSPVPPGVLGYDPEFNLGRTYDPARAKALLDMYGYVDRDGDGWREMPDGSPLVFRYANEPDQLSRQFSQLWKKGMDAIGVRMEIETAKWPDLRKKSKQGLLQAWQLAWGADYPDGENFYQLLYGPNCGSSNDGCFQLPEFDAIFEKSQRLPPGPERTALYRELARLVAAWAPWKLTVHRRYNHMTQPWVVGWRKHPFLHEGYRYVDIDLDERSKRLK